MSDAPIQEVLALEQELNARIAASAVQLDAELATLRTALEEECVAHDAALLAEGEERLAAVAAAEELTAATALEAASAYARQLDALDETTLTRLLLPLLERLLPGRSP